MIWWVSLCCKPTELHPQISNGAISASWPGKSISSGQRCIGPVLDIDKKWEVIAPEIGGTLILSPIDIWKQEWSFFKLIYDPRFLENLQGRACLGERDVELLLIGLEWVIRAMWKEVLYIISWAGAAAHVVLCSWAREPCSCKALWKSSVSIGGTSPQSLGQPSQVPARPQSKSTELGCRVAAMERGQCMFLGSGLRGWRLGGAVTQKICLESWRTPGHVKEDCGTTSALHCLC